MEWRLSSMDLLCLLEFDETNLILDLAGEFDLMAREVGRMQPTSSPSLEELASIFRRCIIRKFRHESRTVP